MTNPDYRLQNYLTALRSLRITRTEAERSECLNGFFKLTSLTEKDPRLRARLEAVIAEETKRSSA